MKTAIITTEKATNRSDCLDLRDHKWHLLSKHARDKGIVVTLLVPNNSLTVPQFATFPSLPGITLLDLSNNLLETPVLARAFSLFPNLKVTPLCAIDDRVWMCQATDFPRL